jgi:L-lysine 6-monooxygenase/L-ornithine 5-monooxygenase
MAEQRAVVAGDLDVAIIGAGPYGLATAAHLAGTRLRIQVFGRLMDTWLNRMPEGMLLKSKGLASSIADPARKLTLHRYCTEHAEPYAELGLPIPREVFADYGVWFAERAAGEIRTEDVRCLRRSDHGYVLDFEQDTVHAREVVVATGLTHFPYVPEELSQVPTGWVSHSSQYGSLDALRGRRVAVIGSGQSALELAVLLRESGALPHLIARRTALTWNGPPVPSRGALRRLRNPVSPLGGGVFLWALSYGARFYRCLPSATRERLAWETLGPSGAWWLRERFESIPVFLGCRLADASVRAGALRVTVDGPEGRRDIEVDHAIAATGYRPRLGSLPFLDAELGRTVQLMRSGLPLLDGAAESSASGLYFVGIMASPLFGPSMRFVTGTGTAARAVSRRILARRRVRLRAHRAATTHRSAERAA